MRILLVPDPTAPNGEDALCREIIKRAGPRGHTAQIQVVPNGPLDATLETLAAARFSRDFDVVLVNSLQPAALLAAKAAGRKVAVRFIDSYAGATQAAIAEVRRLLGHADLLIMPSRHLEEVVKAWGLNGAARVVPYAYDRIGAQRIALVTSRASRPNGFQIIAAGAFTDATVAGYETLISAVARLRLDWHLVMIGDGKTRPALEEKARQLGAAARIAFLGDLPHPKIMEYFRVSKVYVDPCGVDGFPMLSLHALSEGCPVIAARAGALTELIRDQENGLLFKPGDVSTLSEAIVTLSSVQGLSLKLIAGGIATIERHSWEETVKATLTALEEIQP